MDFNFCPKCGAKLQPGMNFCPNCGAALTATESNTQAQPQQAQTETPKMGTLTVIYEGYWILFDASYEFLYNGKHYSNFSFKSPFRYDLPIEQARIELKVKKLFMYWGFKFTVDPFVNYICKLTYDRVSKQFNFTVYDENNKKVCKDTLF